MKTIISLATLIFLLLNALAQQPDRGPQTGSPLGVAGYSQLKADAERFYAQGSYARSNEIYSKFQKTSLAADETRWVEFRLADTSWRAQAATETPDTTKFEQAQKQLEELIRSNDKDDDRDLVWAEAHESLGDFFWTRRSQMNWGAAWPHYQPALEWWAGQRDLDRARDRYLRIVFKADESPRPDEYYYYTHYGNYIPLNVLENALKISRNENDKVHLHFLIAMTMRSTGGDWEQRQRVPEEFEAALKAGKLADWYDDALFHYAEWMNSNGVIRQLDDGQWQQEFDYVKALELYRRLTKEFLKGETSHYDHVQQQIKNITTPTIGLGVANIFLPGSELQFGLNARNVRQVDLTLYRVDLTSDVRFLRISDEDEGEVEDADNNWIQKIEIDGRTVVKAWSRDLLDKGDYKPTSEQVRIDSKLPVGAYLLEAKSGSLSARDLILVTDASLVLKSSPKQALVYFSHALTGAPIPNANIALWERYCRNSKWLWRRLRQTTNSEGLATFALKRVAGGDLNLFASAADNERQAFAAGYANRNNVGEMWRIYAFTDRPAYRPKETVQWKFIARRLNSGVYSTPANQVVEYEIHDPRGTKVSEGKATLNAFGSAWGALELREQLPLGQYNIQFWDQGRNTGIGSATLFRLEEYKLPEFKVAVKTPEQYFKLVNHPTLLKGFVSERVPLNDGDTVKSGERVEVVLTIEGKNNYEYLLFEDLKPGGLEAVQIRSGENLYVQEVKSGALSGKNATLMNYKSANDFTGRQRWVYQELRDRKVALFIDKLPQGVWQVSYEMRAESPGSFHALPVLGHTMYVPEIRTNGAEVRIRVVD